MKQKGLNLNFIAHYRSNNNTEAKSFEENIDEYFNSFSLPLIFCFLFPAGEIDIEKISY